MRGLRQAPEVTLNQRELVADTRQVDAILKHPFGSESRIHRLGWALESIR